MLSTAQNAVTAEVTVGLPPKRAYRAFVCEAYEWWPSEYTWSRDGLEKIVIESQRGGACYEVGPEGFRCDFGKVIIHESPRRLVLRWQIGPTRVPEPDPARSSEVEVIFTEAEGGGTRVRLEHRNFSRHGEGADAYLEAMGSELGWPLILERYREFAA